MKDKKQVVIVSDIRSDKIEQAIFILRDGGKALLSKNGEDSEIVLEAQRILNGFLYDKPKFLPAEPKKNIFVGGIICLLSAASVVALSLLILGFLK